jgi:hypothetical protein
MHGLDLQALVVPEQRAVVQEKNALLFDRMFRNAFQPIVNFF